MLFIKTATGDGQSAGEHFEKSGGGPRGQGGAVPPHVLHRRGGNAGLCADWCCALGRLLRFQRSRSRRANTGRLVADYTVVQKKGSHYFFVSDSKSEANRWVITDCIVVQKKGSRYSIVSHSKSETNLLFPIQNRKLTDG